MSRGTRSRPSGHGATKPGLKSTLAGGRARLNGAIFYTDYTNLQVLTTIRPGIAEVTNAAEATIRGAELEVTWQLGPGLQVGGHVAWLDARYDQYLAVGVNSVTSDVAGHFLSNSPEWSGRGFIHWSLAAGRVGTVSLRADARFQSTVYFTPSNEPLQRQRPYSLLDASLRLGRDHLDCRLRPQPDGGGLRHRHVRRGAARDRRPSRRAAASRPRAHAGQIANASL